MRTILILIALKVLSGCSCDSICKAHRDSVRFFNNNPTDIEIIEYLNEYIGEAPGSEKYSIFIEWGLNKPERFVALMNHPSINEVNLKMVIFNIINAGVSVEYCDFYRERNETENDRYIRKSLQECNFEL